MPDSLLQGKIEVVPRRRQPTVTDAVLLVGITFGVLLMLRELVRVLSWPLLLGVSVLLSIVAAYGYGFFSRRWRKERRAERVAASQHGHRTKTDETARETETDAESTTEAPVNSKNMIEQAGSEKRVQSAEAQKAQQQAEAIRAEVAAEAQKVLEQAREVADHIRAEAEQEQAALFSESEQVRELPDGLLDHLGRVHGEISGLLREWTRNQRDQARTETAQPTGQVTTRRQELESYIDALRDFERGYRSRLRGFIESQIEILDDIAPYESIGSSEADAPTEPLRAFVRDYRARLRGFVEGQLKALEDAAPSGPVAPPPPPGLGGTSQPLPGAEELPSLPTGPRQSSYSTLRERTSDQLGENGRDKVDRPREE